MHSVLRFASVHMNFFAGVYFSKKKNVYTIVNASCLCISCSLFDIRPHLWEEEP